MTPGVFLVSIPSMFERPHNRPLPIIFGTWKAKFQKLKRKFSTSKLRKHIFPGLFQDGLLIFNHFFIFRLLGFLKVLVLILDGFLEISFVLYWNFFWNIEKCTVWKNKILLSAARLYSYLFVLCSASWRERKTRKLEPSKLPIVWVSERNATTEMLETLGVK